MGRSAYGGSRRRPTTLCRMERGDLIAAFVQYQRVRALSTGTVKRRVTSISSFLDFAHPLSVDEVTPNDVEEWMRGIRDPQTRYSYRSDVKMFYRWCMRQRLVQTNPVDDTDTPRLPRRLPRPLQPADLAAALAVADGDVQLMILLGAFAGLRVSEIARIHDHDIHLTRVPPVLLVNQGKGRRDRVVPLHPTLVSRLRNQPQGWLFASCSGTHIQAQTVTRRIGRVFAHLGLESTPHALRHTFGTEFARVAKGNIIAVAQAMGHASTQTTMGYIGWSPENADMVARMYGDD